jgi:hypothetical protein
VSNVALTSNNSSILEKAASLTDEDVGSAIQTTFPGAKYSKLRRWLASAMAVTPNRRFDATRLKDKSFLNINARSTTAGFVTMLNKLATKEDIEAARRDVIDNIRTLSAEVQEGFAALDSSLNLAAAQAALGDNDILNRLTTLAKTIETKPDDLSATNMEAVSAAVRSAIGDALGEEVQRAFEASVLPQLKSSSTTSTVDSGLLTEVTRKIDVLAEKVGAMGAQISDIQQSVRDIKQLSAAMDARSNKLPKTFIIKPRVVVEKKGIAGFLGKAKQKIAGVVFDESSVLVFVCPVLMREVPCGPDGKGFPLRQLTKTMKRVLPALKWGLIFLKLALSTQGLGAVVPDISGLLPDMNNEYLNSLGTSMTSMLSATQESTLRDGIDTVLRKLDAIASETPPQDIEAWLASVVNNCPVSHYGLKLVTGPEGKSMWVSQGDGEILYGELGQAALSLKSHEVPSMLERAKQQQRLRIKEKVPTAAGVPPPPLPSSTSAQKGLFNFIMQYG